MVQDNEQKFNLEKLEAENKSLKIENALVNQKLGTLSNELDKYKEKYEKTHVSLPEPKTCIELFSSIFFHFYFNFDTDMKILYD